MLQFLTTKQNRLDAVALLTMRFAYKAAGILRYPKKVPSFKRPSYTHVKQNWLDAVAYVNKANMALFTGKIETEARFLAMRFACKAAGVLATSGKSNSLYIRKEDTK